MLALTLTLKPPPTPTPTLTLTLTLPLTLNKNLLRKSVKQKISPNSKTVPNVSLFMAYVPSSPNYVRSVTRIFFRKSNLNVVPQNSHASAMNNLASAENNHVSEP